MATDLSTMQDGPITSPQEIASNSWPRVTEKTGGWRSNQPQPTPTHGQRHLPTLMYKEYESSDTEGFRLLTPENPSLADQVCPNNFYAIYKSRSYLVAKDGTILSKRLSSAAVVSQALFPFVVVARYLVPRSTKR